MDIFSCKNSYLWEYDDGQAVYGHLACSELLVQPAVVCLWAGFFVLGCQWNIGKWR